MPGKFCPKCGKKRVDLYEGLCFECYKEENEFIEAPSEIEITECRECGYWRHRGKWKRPSDELLRKMIREKFDTDLRSVEYRVELKGDHAEVHVEGEVDAEGLMEVEEDHEVDVNFDQELCPVCRRKKNRDYRLKIQLREKEEDRDEEKYRDIESYIREMTSKESERDNRGLSSWKRTVSEGDDYYYGYREIGKSVLDKVNKKFHPSVKKSITKAGVDSEGKRKVRYTYCIRV